MDIPFLRVFRDYVPHIGRLAAFRMVAEYVKPLVAQLLGTPGYFFAV